MTPSLCQFIALSQQWRSWRDQETNQLLTTQQLMVS
jgi:hypothetical protein